MSYIRLTLTRPPPGRLAEVRQHYEQIVAHVATLPGFIAGWVVVPGHGDGEVGRLTVWETAAAANRAANDPHAMALHAQIQFAVSNTPDGAWDRSFDTDRPVSPSAAMHELDPTALAQSVDAFFRHGTP